MSESRRERSRIFCDRVREWLPEYDYGGPGFLRRRLIARHLKHCPECARELAALRRAATLLEALPVRAAPAELWTRLEQQIAAEAAPQARPRRLPALAAAAIALALALGLTLRHAPEPPMPTADYVRSHLTLARSNPLAPQSGLDTLMLLETRGK